MNQLVIDKRKNHTLVGRRINKEIVGIRVFKSTSESVMGSIYVGRVASITESPKGIFVHIGLEDNVFVDQKDLPIQVKQGDAIIVKVFRDELDGKSPRATARIEFKGQYCVFMAHQKGVFASKELKRDLRLSELKAIAEKIAGDRFGVMIRSDASITDTKTFENELQILAQKWGDMEKKLSYILPPVCLSKSSGLFHYIEHESNKGYEVVYENDLYEHVDSVLARQVVLRSGGNLVIDECEALTAIDVNSKSDTVENANLEAVERAIREIELRDIGGMILIDLIDNGGNAKSKRQLIKVANETIKKIDSTCHVHGITKLGLMELTRPKAASIKSIIGDKCLKCGSLSQHSILWKEDEKSFDI